MRRKIIIGVVVVLALIAAWTLSLLADVGAFTTLEPHFAGTCRRIEGAMGTEDLTIDPRRRIAYVSSTDRRKSLAGEPVPGGIYRYALDAPEAGFTNLTPDAGVDFQPHGISFWRGKDGREVLFVVNHPWSESGPQKDEIVVFDIVDGALVRRPETHVDDEMLVMANDIVGVGPDRFYVTNTHSTRPGVVQAIETALRLEWARVVYFDGEVFRPAIEDLAFPNGINVSADGSRLYLAQTTLQSVWVYARDPATESLRRIREIEVPGGLDNIEVATDGAIWLAAHAKMLTFGNHALDPQALSPSRVVRIEPESGVVDEVYLDLGDGISGSSVAGVLGDRMLIGQVFDDGIEDCTLAPKQ